jgi:outer membrane protein TolC
MKTRAAAVGAPKARPSMVLRAAGAVLCVAGLALGQAPPDPVPLTLAEAIVLAERADPELAAASEAALAASQRARAAGRFWFPSLGLDAVWARTDVPARVFAQKLNRGELDSGDLALESLNQPSADSNLETSLGLRLPLDVSGSLRASAARAGAAAEAEEERARAARGDLRLAVTTVFHAVAAAEREVAAAESSLEAAVGLERETQARHELGAALVSDLLKARSRRRRRDVEVARARSDAELRRARLRSLLGWPPGGPVQVEAAPATGEERALEEWVREALSGSPEIGAARAGARAAREALRFERLSALPSLEAAGSVQDDRARFSGGAQSAAVALQLRWSLWDPARRFRTAAADAERASAEAAVNAAETAARLAVETRWRELRLARLAADAAREDRTDAGEVFRVARERWLAGKASMADTLDAESELAAASAAHARAEAGVAAARAALDRTAGAIPGKE